MPTEEFNADAALNRVLSAITPFRQSAHAATEEGQVRNITSQAVREATEAIGMPLTQEVAMGLLFAAVLRLADIWNGEGTVPEIPDHMPEA